MPQTKHIGGLDQLDKSDVNTLDLIRHAARILKISLNVDSCNDESPEVDALEKGLSFREQWVLKWLIRRFNNEVQHFQSHPNESRASFLQTHEAWRLLLHLLSVIPSSVACEILNERKFLPCLDKSLQWLLSSNTRSDDSDEEGGSRLEASNEVTSADEEGRPTKRRRTSPAALPQTSRVEPKRAVLDLAVRVIRRCGRFLDPAESPDESILQSGTSDLTSSAEESASLLGTSMRVLLRVLPESPDTGALQLLSTSITEILRLWTARTVQNVTGTSAEDVKVFNRYCLGPSLAILQVAALWSKSTDQVVKANMRPLEKQLALHTVLPLRKLFNEKHAKSWKARQHPLMWPAIQTVYDDFSRVLSPDRPESNAGVLNMTSPEWSSQCALIFTTATRLIPKHDLRRKQWEQPCLDALLVVLSYISCPRLSKLITLEDGSIELLDPVYPEGLRNHFPSLQALLQTVSDQNLRPDVSLVSYFAGAVLSSTVVSNAWPAIAKLVNIEAEAFLPDKNLATTEFAATQLNNAIERAIIDSDTYGVLAQNIILPMLRYCARSRSLDYFLDLWQRGMEEAMRVYTEVVDPLDRRRAVLVWLDEDLFEEAVVQVDRYATTSLYQEMLSHTLDDVRKLTSRSGTTVDVFARIALCDVALRSSRGSDRNFAADTLLDLQAAIISALQRRSDYQKQRWRLWSLLQAMHEAADAIVLPEELLEISEPDLSQQSSTSDLVPSQCGEVLARFSLLALLATSRNDNFVAAFKREVQALHALIRTLLSKTETQSKPFRAWHGRLFDLNSLYKLACASVGVLNSRPTLYSLVPSFLCDVLEMNVVGRESTSLHEGNSDVTVILEDLLQEAVDGERLTKAARDDPGLRKGLHSRERSIKKQITRQPNGDDSKKALSIDRTSYSIMEVDPGVVLKDLKKKLEDLAVVELKCIKDKSNAAIELLALTAHSVIVDLNDDETRVLLDIVVRTAWKQKLGRLGSLLVAAVLFRTASTELPLNSGLADALADIASLKHCTSARDAQLLVLDLENSMFVLEVHSGIINQSTIDTLLSNMCNVVSSAIPTDQNTPLAMQTSPDLVFDRVCAMLGSMLSRHRRRLSDRHHLLLPLLQQLLRCLFYPGTQALSTSRIPAQGSNPASFLKTLPIWLRNSDLALPPSAAMNLSRLLSSICNPTVSAARSSMKRQKNELNDETKRVQAIAGQHLQYLVMTYARSTLDGEIVPEVKEKLMPGMYAVLDSLSRDVMRAMNAAMDPGGRAIFKTLYDDWTRYGKWDKT